MTPDQPVILSQREQEYLLRAIEGAVQVRDARQFFLWTQGQFQALLPHEVMVAMQFDRHGTLLHLEVMHANVLEAAALRRLCDPTHGLAPRLARQCGAHGQFPFTGEGAQSTLLAPFRQELEAAGYPNLMLHSSGPLQEGATVFALFGLPHRPAWRHAYFLELLLPHLHLALLRVVSLPVAAVPHASLARPLSQREQEVARWLREGKTNDEIGVILGLSALTVKNHLQRMYRLLGVENRTQAVARCVGLRLLPERS